MKRLQNDRGFTMVELIVTIALMIIVGGAITSFIIVSQKNYNQGAAEADLQYEAQQLSNQLQDLMLDASSGISYQYRGEMADGSAAEGFLMDDSEMSNSVAAVTKELYLYDKESYYLIAWDSAAKKVYYTEYEANEAGTVLTDPELMAEFVTFFSVDLRETASKGTVNYTIAFQKEGTGKEYSTTHKIKLRNEVLVNADYADQRQMNEEIAREE